MQSILVHNIKTNDMPIQMLKQKFKNQDSLPEHQI